MGAENQGSSARGRSELASFLRAHRPDILSDWESAVRARATASHCAEPALIDDVPDLLETIARAAEEHHDDGDPQAPRREAHRYARSRLDAGFDLSEVIAELGQLRESIMTLWLRETRAKLSESDVLAVNRELDRAMGSFAERCSTPAKTQRLLESERAARERAEEGLRFRDNLLSVVSHDLKGPLGTIFMGASMIMKNTMPGERGRRAKRQAERIQRAAERMNRLIHDLVDLASIHEGRLKIDPAPEQAAAIIEEAVDAFRPAAEERELQLTTAVEAELPEVSCDRDRIVQALSNIVDNAVKVTPHGGTIAIEAKLTGNEIVVSVTDTGPGLRPEEIEHAFERAWRSPRPRYKGTGLGLTITKGIVEAHGGRLWIESTLGRGASFFLTVPLVASMRHVELTGLE